MAVDIDLSVQFARLADGQVLFENTLEYQFRKQPFTRWGANDAKLFRAELEVAKRAFAGERSAMNFQTGWPLRTSADSVCESIIPGILS